MINPNTTLHSSNLGVMYRRGLGGLPQSDTLAMEWFHKAADQGYDNAKLNLSLHTTDKCERHSDSIVIQYLKGMAMC